MSAFDELRRLLYGHGFTLELLPDPHLKNRSPSFLARLVARHPVDYWILAGLSHLGQSWFEDQRLAAVVMGNPFPGVRLPSVNDDLKSATRHAAGLFLGLGHRRIAFLVRHLGFAGEAAEEDGFKEAFRNREGNALPLVVRHPGSVEALRTRLAHLFEASQPPTALLVSHAGDFLTVWTWLLERAIPIPEKVSLISLQWEAFLEQLHPAPACYQSDPRQHAAQLCRRIVHYEPGTPSVRLIPKFWKNGSVASP